MKKVDILEGSSVDSVSLRRVLRLLRIADFTEAEADYYWDRVWRYLALPGIDAQSRALCHLYKQLRKAQYHLEVKA